MSVSWSQGHEVLSRLDLTPRQRSRALRRLPQEFEGTVQGFVVSTLRGVVPNPELAAAVKKAKALFTEIGIDGSLPTHLGDNLIALYQAEQRETIRIAEDARPPSREELSTTIEAALDRTDCRSDIATGRVRGMCGTFSDRIRRDLQEEAFIPAALDTSSHRDGSGHVYLTTEIAGGETLIIDPTIGQFIAGYDRVFVGTRAALRGLVLDRETTIINTRSRNDPEEAFERIWGTTGAQQAFGQ